MPAYDYKCCDCEEVFEITRPASDRSPVSCPHCGGETKRVFTPVGVHFKGSGFHNTDYRQKPKEHKPAAESAPSCPNAGSGEGCSSCPAAS